MVATRAEPTNSISTGSAPAREQAPASVPRFAYRFLNAVLIVTRRENNSRTQRNALSAAIVLAAYASGRGGQESVRSPDGACGKTEGFHTVEYTPRNSITLFGRVRCFEDFWAEAAEAIPCVQSLCRT